MKIISLALSSLQGSLTLCLPFTLCRKELLCSQYVCTLGSVLQTAAPSGQEPGPPEPTVLTALKALKLFYSKINLNASLSFFLDQQPILLSLNGGQLEITSINPSSLSEGFNLVCCN